VGRTRTVGTRPRPGTARSNVGWASALVGAAGVAAAGAELSGNDDPSLLTVGLWGSVALFAAVGAVVQYRRDLSDRRAGGPDGRAGQDPSFCQLPPDITDFTGRETAVTEVEQYFAGWWESDVEAPPICAISGMGGVGKTAFAVHVAHRLRERYPDGQFYVNLRGAEKSRLEPGGVLSDFLRTLGAEGPAIPVGVEARAALYRSKLVGRRMLVVLDNAAEEAQVRPLLPGTWSCGVLVTSRRPMTGLEGTRCVSMDVMDQESGRTLLVRILGADRVGGEPAAADELLRLCGYLPLAIRVAAGRLLAKPHWTIADSVDRLRRQRQRLGELQHGDLDVRASLKLSFDALSGTDRDSFSRLGLLRARDFGVWPVSALLDSTAEVAADFVERMVEAQLVDVLGRDINGRLRFQLHDLVHDFAVQLAGELPDDVRAAAIERLAGAHLTLITAAEDRFQPGEIRIVGDAPRWATPT
jgi:hypothetical protein